MADLTQIIQVGQQAGRHTTRTQEVVVMQSLRPCIFVCVWPGVLAIRFH